MIRAKLFDDAGHSVKLGHRGVRVPNLTTIRGDDDNARSQTARIMADSELHQVLLEVRAKLDLEEDPLLRVRSRQHEIGVVVHPRTVPVRGLAGGCSDAVARERMAKVVGKV